MKRFLLVLGFLFFIVTGAFSQIAKWTFEAVTTTNTGTSPTFSVGSAVADAGTQTGGSLCTGLHASASTVWSNPSGNGSTKAISSDHWAIGDYYQFLFNTTGYNALSITWDATGSNTGPKDFKVQYSTDGSAFTDATGTNSTYVLTNDGWTMGTPVAASTRTLDLSGVAALQNTATVYIRLVVTSTTSVSGGVVATGGTSRVDNFTVNGNVLSSNTITVGLLSSVTFNIDCFTDGSATIDFTSTGTFNAGNNYVAQLSDAAGSFASPTVVGTLSSTSNSGTISITIPAGTATGAGYLIRIVSTNPVVTSGNTSATITINLSGVCTSLATDYFRSKATGNWNVNTTWQSSTTGTAGTWINATLTPTSSANTIEIRNGHTVSITSTESADQVVIESGGILNQASGAFTINDGPGDDVDIQNGGVFTLSFSANPPLFGAGSPTVNVATGGTLRISASGMTSAAPANGVNASNYVYQHQSILEYTLNGGFSSSSVTYFPNVNATTIPIFRATNPTASNLIVGANNPTTINGVFEYTSTTADLIWQNTGNKTFRNGIRGAGNFTANASAATAKFIINGVTAELGGTGSLVVPTTGGLEIGSGSNATAVTVTSSKTITGDVSLLSTNNTSVDLGTNDLIVSGTISGGATNAYIKTSGTGVLKLGTVTSKTFPVGNSSYNPLVVFSGGGADFSARIIDGISPAIAFPTYGINRTWILFASAVTPGVNVSYQYALADANAGALPQPQNMELLINTDPTTPGPWSLVAGNTTITPIGSDPYTVTTTTALTINTDPNVRYALGKSGGWILPIDCIISARAQKRNNTGIISWTINSCAEVTSFEIQRASGNGNYQTIGTINPVANQTDFNFTDPSLLKGANLYRIKVNRLSGSIKYSNTVAIVYDSDELLVSSVVPNPAHDIATLNLSAAHAGGAEFKLYNLAGNLVKQWHSNFAEGNNIIEMDVKNLPAGVYHVLLSTMYTKAITRFVKQ